MTDPDSWQRIRPVAMAAVTREDELFVMRETHPETGELFYRLPGGGIRFGERAGAAVRREIDEEFDLTFEVDRRIGTLDRPFTFLGEPHHEHWWIYHGTFLEERPYERDVVSGYEGQLDIDLEATWMPVETLLDPTVTFYVDEVIDLIPGVDGASRSDRSDVPDSQP